MSRSDKLSELFGVRLRRARETRRLSQADLAAKAELPASSISHFEAGSRKPSLESLRHLVVALEVSADVLLGRTDELGGSPDVDPLCRVLRGLSEADRRLTWAFLRGLVRGKGGAR